MLKYKSTPLHYTTLRSIKNIPFHITVKFELCYIYIYIKPQKTMHTFIEGHSKLPILSIFEWDPSIFDKQNSRAPKKLPNETFHDVFFVAFGSIFSFSVGFLTAARSRQILETISVHITRGKNGCSRVSWQFPRISGKFNPIPTLGSI